MSDSPIEPSRDGKLIQKHLEDIGMEPWYFIYQNYVNPTHQKKDED